MDDSQFPGLPAHSHAGSESTRNLRGLVSHSKTATTSQNRRELQQTQSSSPIGHLPDELLLEVFSYVCSGHINVGRLREPIWNLQQVCVRWQQMVKSAPKLWSAIQVVTTGDVRADTIALRIHSCLKLSGKTSLSIYLKQFPRPRVQDIPFKIFTELFDHANRWESLMIDGGMLEHIVAHTLSMESAATVHDFSRLRMLELIYSQRHYCFFRGATALKEFRLLAPHALPTPPEAFPWMNIETFAFESCTTVQSERRFIHAFTSMAKTLQVLIWKGNDEVLHNVPEGVVITLSALHTLIISEAEIDDWDSTSVVPVPLWAMFRMPSLTCIQFIGNLVFSCDSLLLMIQLSGSVVKKLQFKDCRVPIFLLAAGALHDVEEVSLQDIWYPKKFIPMLVWNTTDPKMRSIARTDVIKILPSLRSLEFRDAREDGAGTNLMDIMRSRSVTAAAESANDVLSPLQSLKWRLSSSADDYDTVSQVKNLGNELGIKVEVDLHWISWMVCRYW